MNKLKYLITAAVVTVASAVTFMTGCTPDDSILIAAANTAGNLGLSAWFAIDDPDQQVKTVLKDVVQIVGESASAISDGGSYVDALAPHIQELIAKRDELTPAQKNLINTGAVVILGTLDTFLDSKPEVRGNADRVSKVVAAFCKGCLVAITRSEDCCSEKSLKKAHQILRMQYSVSAKAFTSAAR